MTGIGSSVVADGMRYRGRTCLLKRSSEVRHDALELGDGGIDGVEVGRWHCVTGYLSPHCSPEQQALQELFEETGLGVSDLESFQPGLIL